MLDSDTKRRIDTARDILVGKVPDPKSQVDQITIALIYKFMDDIDAQSEEWGGDRTFFAGEFSRYGWAKLMSPGLGGHERLNLYAESISRMGENPGVPPLFRAIFDNAFLPYRDPETLTAFLKIIDQFNYDHSERLGDSFEYLLQVMGAQGDAGQFRTPRHIIDFIVRIVDPQKHETILDPACGTAGFLISAYKHIRAANIDEHGILTLTPDDIKRLFANITGYDISPDMVRLSLANMYLHGFPDPHVYEYDTLTSEERWNERADVILANPPFMSPKGGIRPHNRFGVQSKRSEVLFVDYIAEHLTPGGRAGVIVPEGVIFQSQRAYTQLRKMLIEEYLAAVVSLPAGVFNPYSGVKTSILLLDTAIARKTDRIAFFKVENDGFDLGAQRRPIDANDLPSVEAELAAYLRAARAGEPMDDTHLEHCMIVDKQRIAADGEYNLSAERYTEQSNDDTKYPWYPIGSLITTVTPRVKVPKSEFNETGLYPIIDQSQTPVAGYTNDPAGLITPDKPLVIFGDHTCVVKLMETPFIQGADGIKIICTKDELDPRFLYHVLRANPLDNDGYKRHFTLLKRKQIPLPPLAVQREIVEEVEGYQRVIEGTRAVLESWRPRVQVEPGEDVANDEDYNLSAERYSETDTTRVSVMRMSDEEYAEHAKRAINLAPPPFRSVELKEIAEIKSGNPAPQDDRYFDGGEFPFIRTSDVGAVHYSDNFIGSADKVNQTAVDELRLRLFPAGTILFPKSGASTFLNHRVLLGEPAYVSSHLACIVCDEERVLSKYAYHILRCVDARKITPDQAYPSLRLTHIGNIPIPLPSLAVQRRIVAEIEAEGKLVAANRELAARMEDRIWSVLSLVLP